MGFDSLVRNGTVIDGTGRLRFEADIGISRGRIAAIGPLGEAGAAHTIDAAGLIVAPGFIDIHSHSDMSLFDDPGGDSKAYQGVTTEVVGNCSFSPFPIRPDGKADFGMGSMDWPVEWKWRDLDGWATALESRGISLNVAPQVGQAALQIAVGATQDRPVTPDEMSAMQRLASEAIEQGAFSISTGLSLSPSEYMSTDEVIELCKAISHYEGVFYATHSRFGAGKHVMAIEEAVDIGQRSGMPVQYSHLAILSRPDLGGWRKPSGRNGHGPEMLEVFEKARNDGLDITYDSHPYNAAGAGIEQLVPTWGPGGRHRRIYGAPEGPRHAQAHPGGGRIRFRTRSAQIRHMGNFRRTVGRQPGCSRALHRGDSRRARNRGRGGRAPARRRGEGSRVSRRPRPGGAGHAVLSISSHRNGELRRQRHIANGSPRA